MGRGGHVIPSSHTCETMAKLESVSSSPQGASLYTHMASLGSRSPLLQRNECSSDLAQSRSGSSINSLCSAEQLLFFCEP